jgi:hypothetical protein
VIENVMPNTWELVYSTPWLDSTATTNNIRAIAGGDLDGDGFGEIVFLSGREFSETNPNIDDLPVGIYVFENIGDNDFGTAPVSVYEFDDNLPDRWRAEQMVIADIDGDGLEELMFGNNGASSTFGVGRSSAERWPYAHCEAPGMRSGKRGPVPADMYLSPN